MSDTVITAENLCKKYTIGHQKQARYETFRESLNHMGRGMLQRLRHPLSPNKENVDIENFWALKDVNFEIKQGDRVGIIGRNGAGKSTLLKILSRITEPTSGRVTIKGRVASLLEVGTGFHPELTGRENVFLNGAILGMSRVEINKKFDEIVDFAEIEKFLDTPVKRYSSGMYVRLAFAVAAHLEPKILLVDEVLAVGDAQFQKKCLGKMEEINKQGRTVMIVSHNLALIRSLCNRTILFEKSKLFLDSSTETTITNYLSVHGNNDASIFWKNDDDVLSEFVLFRSAYLQNNALDKISSVDSESDFYIIIKYEVLKSVKNLRVGFMLQNNEGVLICGSNDPMAWEKEYRDTGIYQSCCRFPANILAEGLYSVCFGADKFPHHTPLIKTDYCLSFKVNDSYRHGYTKEILPGVIKPKLFWEVHQINIKQER